MNKKGTVFVGLSGGVDSSVSALLLKKEGYEVVGVFIKTWHPDFLVCNEEEERRDAMRVASFLNIPFLTFDLEDVYKKEVADYMIDEYKKGRTPNPDVMCNKEVKFGAFLKKSLAMGADFVATGHYAVSQKNKDGTFSLLCGNDPSKDQTYFLWTLSQKELEHIIFPVGHLNKKEVRRIALKAKLPVAEKKDSQGICFLGAVDLKDFLKHYIKEKKGKVLNEDGEKIGYHNGAVFYTLGERRGFVIDAKINNEKPYYVVAKDIKKNTLVVAHSSSPLLLEKNNLNQKSFIIENTNWINGAPKENFNYSAEIRYHGERYGCSISLKKKNMAEVFFEKPVLMAKGQSLVIYDKKVCIGGGTLV
ncbi:MAG: tRNA 2-thiouridine(34) synthase MnmA [Candidatus Pacebacteria bacterium]|nr:tRNA 2-thiouridine(34) synthase MnmA [Candidatus Paceibacterota bacterium]MCF7862926.1 tRNA 2-thiouridine(34) synthase MnmA [Candidatus Paceibacterota bacterium]